MIQSLNNEMQEFDNINSLFSVVRIFVNIWFIPLQTVLGQGLFDYDNLLFYSEGYKFINLTSNTKKRHDVKGSHASCVRPGLCTQRHNELRNLTLDSIFSIFECIQGYAHLKHAHYFAYPMARSSVQACKHWVWWLFDVQ